MVTKLNKKDLKLINEWFNYVKDINKKYLKQKDYNLIDKIDKLQLSENSKVKLKDSFDNIDNMYFSDEVKKLEGEIVTIEEISFICKEDKFGHPIVLDMVKKVINEG